MEIRQTEIKLTWSTSGSIYDPTENDMDLLNLRKTFIQPLEFALGPDMSYFDTVHRHKLTLISLPNHPDRSLFLESLSGCTGNSGWSLSLPKLNLKMTQSSNSQGSWPSWWTIKHHQFVLTQWVCHSQCISWNFLLNLIVMILIILVSVLIIL
jgi:hypothetical protein